MRAAPIRPRKPYECPKCGHNAPGVRRSRVPGHMMFFCIVCDHEWPILETTETA